MLSIMKKVHFEYIAFVLHELTSSYIIYNSGIFSSVFIRQGKDRKAEVVLLDHGLYDYLQPAHREYLCNLYKAIIMRNEEEMEKFSHLLGVKGQWHCITLGVI